FGALARALALVPDVDVLVIGRGSNMLVADAGFPGLALVLGGEFDGLSIDHRTARVDAGAAVALPVLARQAAGAGIGALEFFVGGPGARADDGHALVREVQRRVEDATGVRLEPELRLVGFAHSDEEVGR